MLKTTGLTRRDWYLENNDKYASISFAYEIWSKDAALFTTVSARFFLTCDAFFSEPALGRLRLCPRVAKVVSGRVVLLDGVT